MTAEEDTTYTARIETPLHPTEDHGLVLSALDNIFPEGEFTVEEHRIAGHADLSRLKHMLMQQRIRDTARSHMLSRSGPPLRFLLSKQAAAAGCANLTGGHGPLGDMEVLVEGDAHGAIDWLTGGEAEHTAKSQEEEAP